MSWPIGRPVGLVGNIVTPIEPWVVHCEYLFDAEPHLESPFCMIKIAANNPELKIYQSYAGGLTKRA